MRGIINIRLGRPSGKVPRCRIGAIGIGCLAEKIVVAIIGILRYSPIMLSLESRKFFLISPRIVDFLNI